MRTLLLCLLSLSSFAQPYLKDFYPESYGAKRDNSTVDTVAIQAAINAAQSNGGGVVWIGPGTYLISTVAVTTSNVKIKGALPGGCVLHSTTAGTDIVTITGPAWQNWINFDAVEDVTLDRSVLPTGTAAGIRATFTANLRLSNVTVTNPVYGFYFKGTNQTRAERCIVDWPADGVSYTSGTYYAYYLDDSNPNYSLGLSWDNAYNLGFPSGGVPTSVTLIGLYVASAEIRDLAADHFQTFGVSYCAELNPTSPTFDGDIHFSHPLCDSYTQAGIWANGLNTQGQVTIADGWFSPYGTGTMTGVKITGTSGVAISHSQFASDYNPAGAIGVSADAQSARLTIAGANTFRSGLHFVVLNQSQQVSIVGNSFLNDISANPTSPGIQSIGASKLTIVGNHFDAFPTQNSTAISLDSGTTGSTVTGNPCNNYATCVSNLGTGNYVEDPALGLPVPTTATPNNGDCVTWVVSGGQLKLGTSGAPCGNGGGGGGSACSSTAPAILNTAAAGNVQVIAGSGTLSTYLCDVVWASSGLGDVKLTAGTGTNCGTGTTDLTGLLKNVSAFDHAFEGSLIAGSGESVCFNQSVGNTTGVTITYAQR